MAKATKRISRTHSPRKSRLQFAASPVAREFRERSKQSWATGHKHFRALPENASRKAIREASAKDDVVRAEHDAYVSAYLARFYKQDDSGGDWTNPKPLKTTADMVELAVAGLERVAPSRALCVAIVRAAGLKI